MEQIINENDVGVPLVQSCEGKETIILSTANRHHNYAQTEPLLKDLHKLSASRLNATQSSQQLPLRMIISDMVQRSYVKCSPEETSFHQEQDRLIQDLTAGPLDFETVKRGYEMSTSYPSKRVCKKRENLHKQESSVYTSQLIGKQRFLLPWNVRENTADKENKQFYDFNAEDACGMTFDTSQAGTSKELSTPLDNEKFNYLYGNSFQMKAGPKKETESCNRISALHQRNSHGASSVDQILKKCKPSRFSAASSAFQKRTSNWDPFDTQCNFTKTSEFVKPKVVGKNTEPMCDDALSCVASENVGPLATAPESCVLPQDNSKVFINPGAVNQLLHNINVSLQSYCYNFLTLASDVDVHEKPQDALPSPARDTNSHPALENLQECILKNICSNSQSPENSEDIFTDEEESVSFSS